MDLVVFSGLSALRWAAWTWMAVVLTVSWHDLRRPWLALIAVGAALAYTTLATWWRRGSVSTLARREVVGAEVALAAALVVCDGWAYGPHHVFSTSQSLGSVWPLVAVLSVGVAFGWRWGAAAGGVLGVSRVGAVLANGVGTLDRARVLSLINTTVFYVVAGVVAGYVVGLLRRAEREISVARAREEVARTLHDGVLQTLAIIERRSNDVDLVRLARRQDRELRGFLFGDHDAAGDEGRDLAVALRRAAGRFEDSFELRVEVLVADDLPKMDQHRVTALSGAVTEALTNAGKHGHPSRVTIFVEPAGDERVFCSVKDDGVGFDPAQTTDGIGVRRSIVDRVREVGGCAEIRSAPGTGTEVCLWV